MHEYSDYDGLGLAELVRARDVSPAELVEAAIERIERRHARGPVAGQAGAARPCSTLACLP